jgi:hypothetical protein
MKNQELKMRGVIVLDLEGSFADIADINREIEKFCADIGQDDTVVSHIHGIKTRKGNALIESLASITFRHKGVEL